jgi:hypothetical protein
VLLGQAKDGRHPASERTGCDLLPNELCQLLATEALGPNKIPAESKINRARGRLAESKA